MSITFQKRQKEMKRLEKQRAKAERRAQKKLANRAGTSNPADDTALSPGDDTALSPGDDTASSPNHPEESSS
jgi:hypothetical protein